MGKTRKAFAGTLAMAAIATAMGGSCGDPDPQGQTSETALLAEHAALPPAFEPASPAVAVGKVKNLLIGEPATDEEIAAVTRDSAELKKLVDTWMQSPQFYARMLRFFQNAFQQGQITAASFTEQLPTAQPSPRLLGNFTASFPLTVWQLAMVEGRPFTETLTTDRFAMTAPMATTLAYLDNRHVDDANRGTDYIVAANRTFNFSMSNASGPIPLEKTLTPGDPQYMRWYITSPIPAVTGCADPLVVTADTTRLFQLLFGTVTSPTCVQRITTTPQFTDAEYDAWRMVKIRAPKAGEATTPFYDVLAMRNASELVLRVPRVGFFTTPAFFANWSTNTSNQARVTMNQTLIVALGRSFDDSNNTVPLTSSGLDKKHSEEPACAACHTTLDPMRQVFRQAFTLNYHEQKDPTQVSLPGTFAFDGVTRPIKNPQELAAAMASHPRFAIAWTQKLCYFANSAPCSEDDPEFQRVSALFEQNGWSFKTLLRELFTSPLVTGAANTRTFAEQGETLSVARRDQLCTAMSTRLGVPNLCALGRAPGLTQLVPSDGYSRGSTAPILSTDPSLFYRAATEQLCRAFADYAVDNANVAGTGKPSRYSSKLLEPAFTDLVKTVMGIAPSDPRHAALRQILSEHYGKASKTMGVSVTDALKSTFVLACSAPPSITIGL